MSYRSELETKSTLHLHDTVNSCGGIGWTRVAYLDMTDPGSVCPLTGPYTLLLSGAMIRLGQLDIPVIRQYFQL